MIFTQKKTPRETSMHNKNTSNTSNTFFQICCIFSEQVELSGKKISGMCKLKDSLLFNDINFSHPFLLWCCHYFTGALEAFPYVKGTVFISQHLLQPSIIVCSLWLIRENLKGTLFI